MTDARRRGRALWRANLEAVVMAVVMALFLKHFVVEAYKIPTGSMQPTLIGDEHADIKDRILVDKLSYVVRAPRRWEVAVFRYPLDRSKSFVKRIAGVGPEEFRILHGDLWNRVDGGDWRILRRPAAVQAEAWKRLDLEDPEEDADDDALSRWIPQNLPSSSRWIASGRALQARGAGTASFRGGRESIVDHYLDGYPERLLEWLPAHHDESGANAVGDLRVAGTIRALPGAERFTVVLREGVRRYRFEIPGPAAPADAVMRIDAGPSARPMSAGDLPASGAYRLPAGEEVRFAVQNLDDRLELELDGVTTLAQEIEPAEDQFSAATLALDGEGADLDDLMVWRDIYYTEGGETIAIPAGSYYMLGDNTQDSSDSRVWSYAVFERTERGDDGENGPVARVRGNARGTENPRTVAHGAIDGPLTYLVDEWGEKHWFGRDEARRMSAEPAPFVPRNLIQGKALAVFWPLDPLRGIWRLKWVH